MQQQFLKELLNLNSYNFEDSRKKELKVTELLVQINLLGTIKDLPTVIKAAKDNIAAQQKMIQSQLRSNED